VAGCLSSSRYEPAYACVCRVMITWVPSRALGFLTNRVIDYWFLKNCAPYSWLVKCLNSVILDIGCNTG
jgi:hypothetical protein